MICKRFFLLGVEIGGEKTTGINEVSILSIDIKVYLVKRYHFRVEKERYRKQGQNEVNGQPGSKFNNSPSAVYRKMDMINRPF